MKSSIKTTVLKIVAVCSCVCIMSTAAVAQDGGGLVAVLDVTKVFKDNVVFNQRMEAIKKEAEAFKATMDSEQQSLMREAERLKDFNPGSEEYINLEAKLEQQNASLRTQARQKNTEFLNREAKIYYDTYVQMQNVLDSVAAQYNISLVLRHDSSEINPEIRADVVKGVNRNVVYQKNLDLTKMVIDNMAAVADAGGANLK